MAERRAWIQAGKQGLTTEYKIGWPLKKKLYDVVKWSGEKDWGRTIFNLISNCHRGSCDMAWLCLTLYLPKPGFILLIDVACIPRKLGGAGFMVLSTKNNSAAYCGTWNKIMLLFNTDTTSSTFHRPSKWKRLPPAVNRQYKVYNCRLHGEGYTY